jgi:hypothetical protein
MRDRFASVEHPAVVYITGRRGSGKSFTACELINEWHELDPEGGRVHAIDPVGADDASVPGYLNHYADSWSRGVPDELPAGVSLLVVDEADGVIGVRADQQSPELVDLVRRGRHRGVTLALCTQRPVLLMRDAWALADVVIAHRITDKRDLDRLAELPDADELAREAPELDVGEALVWTPEETRRVSADD